jgi:hypothetical protein
MRPIGCFIRNLIKTATQAEWLNVGQVYHLDKCFLICSRRRFTAFFVFEKLVWPLGFNSLILKFPKRYKSRSALYMCWPLDAYCYLDFWFIFRSELTSEQGSFAITVALRACVQPAPLPERRKIRWMPDNPLFPIELSLGIVLGI